jgi:DNA-binding transcriptional LysR family regulator
MLLPDVEAWLVFAKIAEAGSFAGAATELGLSPATVSKMLKRLETRLGERLVHRSSRRFSLTDAGRTLAVRAARLLAEAEAAEVEAQSKSAAPRGRVRLAAPMSFGLRHVAPALPELLETYPELAIDLQLDDRQVDLVDEGIDVALRIADLPDSSLIARRLCPVRRWVVGAPAYFARHGMPARPRDLAHHACLTYSYQTSGETWRFRQDDGEEAVAVKGRLSATNAEALGAALEAGLGLALQPDFIAWDAVRDGRLAIALPEWTVAPLTLNLVTPTGGPRAARISVLIQFLARRFKIGSAPWTKAPPPRPSAA